MKDRLINYFKLFTKEKYLNDKSDNLFECIKGFIISNINIFIIVLIVLLTILSSFTISSDKGMAFIKTLLNEENNDSKVQIPNRLYDEDIEMINDILNSYGDKLLNENYDCHDIWVSKDILEDSLHHIMVDYKEYQNEHNITDINLSYINTYNVNQPFTKVGQTLIDMGYETVVIDVTSDITSLDNRISNDYKVTMIKIDNKWYIAEDLNTNTRWDECKDIWTLS